MGVRMDLHGVKEIELRRESISVIKNDRIPYEVWNLYIKHRGEEGKGEDFSITLFMVKNQSLKLDAMNTSNLHPEHPPVYEFGIHPGIGSPEDLEDRKILEEIPEESDLTSDLTDEELEESISAIDEILPDPPGGVGEEEDGEYFIDVSDVLENKRKRDLTDEEVIRKNVESIRKLVNEEKK